MTSTSAGTNRTDHFDVIGDIHGHLDALRALGKELGYAVDEGWTHPAGRSLVFLGDLIDGGPQSFEVADLVRRLVEAGRARCLLGNHEYNLVQYRRGRAKRKTSNQRTIDDLEARGSDWTPILDFFEGLPIALDYADLRIIHAVWHVPSVSSVLSILGTADGIASPFETDRLRRDLPSDVVLPGSDRPHEVLFKGFEAETDPPFRDAHGKERRLARVPWWQGHPEVSTDKLTVFGHYWNLPPVGEHTALAPPHPSGHPDHVAWVKACAASVPQRGEADVPGDCTAVCVDYNGIGLAKLRRACLGAFRWPERRVVWACAPA